jgi:hypothetical protein
VLEQAYSDSRDALEQGSYGVALIHSCGILESIVTDSLEHAATASLPMDIGAPIGKIADWSFDERIAVAEKSGLIRGGCARLPEIARRYREIDDAEGNPQLTITEQDARRTMQVLHVVMRDLDPGR